MPRLGVIAILWGALAGAVRADFSDWTDSVRVVFKTAGLGLSGPVNDFPLLVRLEGAAFPANARADGADIRFTDRDGSELSHDIEAWDQAARKADLWVRVPKIDAPPFTDYIVMRWGNSLVTSSANPRAVFDSARGYVGVWHLSENGQPKYLDATASGHDGEDFVSAGAASGGPTLKAQAFDGKDDYISVPDASGLDLAKAVTMSAWIRGNQWALGEVNKEISNPIFRRNPNTPLAYQLGVHDGKLAVNLDTESESSGIHSNASLPPATWLHVAATWDGSKVRLYVDGKLDKEAAFTGTLPSSSAALLLGGRPVTNENFSHDVFNGDLDQLELARVARSADWVLLSHATQKPGSDFLSFQAFDDAQENLGSWTGLRSLVLNTTPDGADVAVGVTDFPLLVRLDSASFPFQEAAAGGADVRFSSPSGQALAYEIERWDAVGKRAELWVLVPMVAGNDKRQWINLHWGKSGAVSRSSPGSVFQALNRFAGVWHLSEDGNTGPDGYRDASQRDNHGRGVAMTASSDTEGRIGKGSSFDAAAGQEIVVPQQDAGLLTTLTVSAWIKAESWTHGNPRIIQKGTSEGQFSLSRETSKDSLLFQVGNLAGRARAPLPAIGEWHHAAGTYDGSTVRLYVDGALINANTAGPLGLAPGDLSIGNKPGSTTKVNNFQGLLDQVEVHQTARSSSWIKLAYESQKDSSRLVSFVDPDGNPDPVDPSAPVDTLLQPGQAATWGGQIVVRNPAGSTVPAKVRISAPGAAGGLGLADLSARIEVDSGDPAPVVVFEAGGTGESGLYRVLAPAAGGGLVEDIGKVAGNPLTIGPGTYLVGRDTVAPRLELVDRGVAGDTSFLDLKVHDNVSMLRLTSESWGHEGSRRDSMPARAGSVVRFRFKPATAALPLKASFAIHDGRQQAGFPPPPAKALTLERVLAEAASPAFPQSSLAWGLAGIPALPSPAVRLSQLETPASGKVYAAVWKKDAQGKGTYDVLAGQDTLPAGQGFWLTAEKTTPQLAFSGGRAFPAPASGFFRVPLTKGWNLITSPSLEAQPWPVHASDMVAADTSIFGRLHAWNLSAGYGASDSLRPWVAYFVHADADTAADLRPPAGPLQKRVSAASEAALLPIHILLDCRASAGASAPLRLGAATYARDGIAIEDEPVLPLPGEAGTVASLRDGRGLGTDLIGYREGGLHVWKLAREPHAGERSGRREASALRVAALRLPGGARLWGASSMHPGPRAVEAGSELALSASADTVLLWAGPPAAWSPGMPLPGLALVPAAFAASWRGGVLRLELPSADGLRLSAWTLSGRRLWRLEQDRLAPGTHAFAPPGNLRLPAGLMIVTVELSSGARRVLMAAFP